MSVLQKGKDGAISILSTYHHVLLAKPQAKAREDIELSYTAIARIHRHA